ncbi:hypothetical protein CLAIMM_13029, partial [Cladophialophora immunda]
WLYVIDQGQKSQRSLSSCLKQSWGSESGGSGESISRRRGGGEADTGSLGHLERRPVSPEEIVVVALTAGRRPNGRVSTILDLERWLMCYLVQRPKALTQTLQTLLAHSHLQVLGS